MVGAALKVRRALAKADIDVSDLSTTEQRLLGRHLATDGGSVDLPIRKLRLDTDAVDGSLASRLMRLRRDGDLPDGSVQRLRRMVNDGEMDEADVRAFTTMLERKDSDPLIDDAVDAEDLLSEVKNNGDLSETIAITKSEDGTVSWLEDGRLAPETRRSDEYIIDEGGAGWVHIKHNRIDNPDGNQFLRYGDRFKSEQEVKELIFETLDKGESVRIDGDQWYRYEVPNSGGKYLSVLVGDNGFTVTAIPTKRTK